MKKFCIKTYGCKLNQADSELIRGLLSKDFKETSADEADFIIFNTCGVVEKTERKILKEVEEWKKRKKKIIISGCLPLISKESCELLADGILGPTNIKSINKISKLILKNKKTLVLSKEKLDKSRLYNYKKRFDKNGATAIVSIAEGCLGSCSYCATRFARKELKSFNSTNIIKEIGKTLNEGYKEIQLTSQDLSVYGLDSGKQKLPKLIKEISAIPDYFKIKLGMMNPGYTKRMIDELLSAYESEKVYKFIHLPLQSGDDRVLKKMNRGYLSKDFIDIAKEFKKKFKDCIIATDIIVGHPLESEESFKKTLAVVKKIKPEIIHIFKFSKRRGTPDYELKDLPDRIKKDRSRILTELFEDNNLIKNKKFLGKKFDALIVEKRKDKYLARTNSGRAVILDEGKIGDFVKIKITGYHWNYLIGELLL